MATCYVKHRFYKKSREKLDAIKALIAGHDVITLRGIHYLLVSNNLTANTGRAYNALKTLLKWARLTGEIHFEKIIDETREPYRQATFDSVVEAVNDRLRQYRSEWWDRQAEYLEVWLEKRTLTRLLYQVTDRYGVFLCVGGGYQSWSEIYDGAQRFGEQKRPRRILYCGDFDPSGEDMDRDIAERFAVLHCPVEVERVALTPEDARAYNLPPQFVKPTDSRTPAFVEKYGTWGWELDALPVKVLQAKVEAAIQAHCDLGLLRQCQERDAREVSAFVNNYEGESDT
jgi:hypothetical protein